ncbi:hypothetical protein [Corynebacterium provencense]|uniref:hypothetical protein n=1 Tax=Corynebacterium provencense TaxID=1737425 RepID=UPI000830A5F6|nr:hypothetical protein [Corynebacterium provencense]
MTITVTEKRCPKCVETKPVDGFYRNRSRRDGLSVWCKECFRAYKKAYDEAHREERRAKDRAYYEAHREERLAHYRAYYEAHREERLAHYRANARDRYALLGDPRRERWQEITAKHATRRGRWSEAEDAYLTASTDRVVDDALALKRTYMSVDARLRDLRRRGVTLARDRVLAA